MTRSQMPILTCDGDDGYCGAVETDYYDGLASRVNDVPITSTQRAPGWVSQDDEDFCPEHYPATATDNTTSPETPDE